MKFGRRPDTSAKAPQVKYSLRQRELNKTRPRKWSYASIAPISLDQGQSSSCVIHATRHVWQAISTKHGEPVVASRLAAYVQAENWYPPPGDNGLESGDGWKVAKDFGWIAEVQVPWPANGDLSNISWTHPPSNEWETTEEPIEVYTIGNSLDSLKNGMWAHGPGLFGFNFAEEWMTLNRDGSFPVPKTLAGGHDISFWGWDDDIILHDDATGTNSLGGIQLLNSWGPDWGIQMPGSKSGGWCWMPYTFWNGQYDNWIPQDTYVVTLP